MSILKNYIKLHIELNLMLPESFSLLKCINYYKMLKFSFFIHVDLERHYEYTGSGEVSGRRLVSNSGDILLGTVTVPLISLLTHKTGKSYFLMKK